MVFHSCLVGIHKQFIEFHFLHAKVFISLTPGKNKVSTLSSKSVNNSVNFPSVLPVLFLFIFQRFWCFVVRSADLTAGVHICSFQLSSPRGRSVMLGDKDWCTISILYTGPYLCGTPAVVEELMCSLTWMFNPALASSLSASPCNIFISASEESSGFIHDQQNKPV